MVILTKTDLEYFFPLFVESLFCDLSPQSLQLLTHIKQPKQFRKSAVIYAAGDMPHFIYILLKGQLQILLKSESNEIRAVRLIEPCEVFGLTEAITNLPYETSAETITPCMCECIRREDFIRFLQDEPKICFRLMKRLALNLQESYQLLCSSMD